MPEAPHRNAAFIGSPAASENFVIMSDSQSQTAPLTNKLAQETSPYLLQHKDNPVAWQSWGPAAFATARRDNKPILLSVGYAACHWCHVMAHESFETEEIAGHMNELFVNIKVDREERPDVDAIYQQALSLLGQQGGWPLTMFLTPDAEPFWGGTYFPPEPRFGRPGFIEVLTRIADVYATDPDGIAKNVALLKDALNKLSRNTPAAGIPPEATDQIAERLLREVDLAEGGIGQAPKFPQPAAFKLLWRAWKRGGEAAYRNAVELTLTKMSQGGIYDHLGGGFARYAVDNHWLVPHFEKMLYDNAQLIDLLTWVWQDTKNPLYEQRLRETVAWILREMIADGDGGGAMPTGAFASSLDADSEGEEGTFYVWDEATIDTLLGDKAATFKDAYDVTPGGNWEGKTILNRSQHPVLKSAAEEARLAMQREVLFAQRAKRERPTWDDKVLADWNGLMIAALARAAPVFGEPAWLAAAERAFAFIMENMSNEGRLLHSWRHGQGRHAAMLDDYVNMSEAALALHEATGKAAYLQQAALWAGILDTHFWDRESGGYFTTADDGERLIVRSKSVYDNAVPAGNGTMVRVLAGLYYMSGEAHWRDKAETLIAAFSGELERNFFPLTTLINSNEFLRGAVQIAIVGEVTDAQTQDLLAVIHGLCIPNQVIQIISPGETLPTSHPAQGKGQIDGTATVYICRGMTCSLPLTETAALAKALA